MAAFANKGVFSPTLASLGNMRSGSSVTVKRAPFAGPRIARKEAAALNGPTGNGAPLLAKYGPQVVVVRRNGKAIASVPLAGLASIKLGK